LFDASELSEYEKDYMHVQRFKDSFFFFDRAYKYWKLKVATRPKKEERFVRYNTYNAILFFIIL